MVTNTDDRVVGPAARIGPVGGHALRGGVAGQPQFPPRSGVASQSRPVIAQRMITRTRWIVRQLSQNLVQDRFRLIHQYTG